MRPPELEVEELSNVNCTPTNFPPQRNEMQTTYRCMQYNIIVDLAFDRIGITCAIRSVLEYFKELYSISPNMSMDNPCMIYV